MGWLGVDWNAWEAIAATGVLVVGFWQAISIRREARQERTLAVCNRYDSDANLGQCLKTLRAARDSGDFLKDARKYRYETVTVLNYLDAIAIGIAQGLYIESLARDHLEAIVDDHCQHYLSERTVKTLDIQLNDFRHLQELRKKWTARQPYYKDGWNLLRRWR